MEAGQQKQDGLLFIELVRALASAASTTRFSEQTDIVKVSAAHLRHICSSSAAPYGYADTPPSHTRRQGLLRHIDSYPETADVQRFALLKLLLPGFCSTLWLAPWLLHSEPP